jgi:hypothetical protein
MAKRLAFLDTLFRVIADEASGNPEFAARLEEAVTGLRSAAPAKKSNRRAKGVLDPFAVFASGEAHLRAELNKLDVERLKDIVAEHGMDPDKLAMKWKTSDRLVERIVETVKSRSRKGDAFRGEAGRNSSLTPTKDAAPQPRPDDLKS